MDNETNGLPIADVAARSFKKVHPRLGEGDYDRKKERDIQAAAAELAEVAGWALFDAEKHSAARRSHQEALFLAKLSGDRAIELLVMQNMAMQAGWTGRPREELAIARSVIEQGRISPRVEAICRVREAKGLAGSGQESEAVRSFDLARSLLQDSERSSDPAWTWWVTTDEIDAARTLGLLSNAAQNGKSMNAAPRNLRDALAHIESVIGEDPSKSHDNEGPWRSVPHVRVVVLSGSGAVMAVREPGDSPKLRM
ncbi:hypothetical protein [Streptomyces caatingaensis]|uniref:hypothetical protein n=1 Tax=Streptomyces caatingaensis TaxID=1678637 RepID=UPI001F529A35|nr:hypothetical protein [Streptomyces caatingaensis]